MDNIKKEMLAIYRPISDMDWMNYKLVKKDVTFHHIQKKVDKGRKDVENGALLMPVAHEYLHLIERCDVDRYIFINKLFRSINEQRSEPTRSQREVMEYLLKEFERIHKWDKDRKGRLLVKRKYMIREFL